MKPLIFKKLGFLLGIYFYVTCFLVNQNDSAAVLQLKSDDHMPLRSNLDLIAESSLDGSKSNPLVIRASENTNEASQFEILFVQILKSVNVNVCRTVIPPHLTINPILSRFIADLHERVAIKKSKVPPSDQHQLIFLIFRCILENKTQFASAVNNLLQMYISIDIPMAERIALILFAPKSHSLSSSLLFTVDESNSPSSVLFDSNAKENSDLFWAAFRAEFGFLFSKPLVSLRVFKESEMCAASVVPFFAHFEIFEIYCEMFYVLKGSAIPIDKNFGHYIVMGFVCHPNIISLLQKNDWFLREQSYGAFSVKNFSSLFPNWSFVSVMQKIVIEVSGALNALSFMDQFDERLFEASPNQVNAYRISFEFVEVLAFIPEFFGNFGCVVPKIRFEDIEYAACALNNEIFLDAEHVIATKLSFYGKAFFSKTSHQLTPFLLTSILYAHILTYNAKETPEAINEFFQKLFSKKYIEDSLPFYRLIFKCENYMVLEMLNVLCSSIMKMQMYTTVTLKPFLDAGKFLEKIADFSELKIVLNSLQSFSLSTALCAAIRQKYEEKEPFSSESKFIVLMDTWFKDENSIKTFVLPSLNHLKSTEAYKRFEPKCNEKIRTLFFFHFMLLKQCISDNLSKN